MHQPGMSGAGRRRSARLPLLLLLVPHLALHAQQIYRSVDAEGHVVFTDHADPSMPQTTVVLSTDKIPPDVIHFCWTNCFTLNLDSGSYRRTDGTQETWTVERFGSDSVILHRHDAPAVWNNNRTDVAYQGQVVDGRLTHVTVAGNPVPDINMAWGAALNTLPGSNAERDRRQSAAAQTPSVAMNAPADSSLPGGDEGEMTATAEPPALPDEAQPQADGEGYLWAPGFWAWRVDQYDWVPGIWVRPPSVGLLWTPGYWAYAGGIYRFHSGYWAPQVGYYGAINYGHGYFGGGFVGGRWVGDAFVYNRSVNNLNASKVSYQGGPHGTTVTPTAAELATAAEPHRAPTLQQRLYVQRMAHPPAIAWTAAGSASNGAAPQTVHPVAAREPSTPAPRVVGARAPPEAPSGPSLAPSQTPTTKVVAAPRIAKPAHPAR